MPRGRIGKLWNHKVRLSPFLVSPGSSSSRDPGHVYLILTAHWDLALSTSRIVREGDRRPDLFR
jgi:hypothetical protein